MKIGSFQNSLDANFGNPDFSVATIRNKSTLFKRTTTIDSRDLVVFVYSLDFLVTGDEFEQKGRLLRCLALYHPEDYLLSSLMEDDRARLWHRIILCHNFIEREIALPSPDVELDRQKQSMDSSAGKTLIANS